MKKIFYFLLLAGSFLPLAFADHGDRHGPCAEDVKKFCSDVKPGGGRIIECMKAHEEDLSEGCKVQQQKMKGMLQEVSQDCQTDIDRFCKGVKPGEGRIASCLKEHRDDLSPECKAEGEKFKKGFLKEHKKED